MFMAVFAGHPFTYIDFKVVRNNVQNKIYNTRESIYNAGWKKQAQKRTKIQQINKDTAYEATSQTRYARISAFVSLV